ncbi:hypothetical protein N7522_001440 [Penicillium canescens]|nr:hypothetical protein N7522_001440 [Penicillium canescens]
MPKEKYLPWTESEEDNLEPWLSEYDWMPWKERAKEYSKQHDKSRSFESLRGKRNQLRKGIRRRRPIADRSTSRARATARRALYRIQRFPQGFPPRPPTFRLKSPDPWARQLLQQVHQYGNPHHQASAPAPQNKGDSQPAISPNNATPGRSTYNQHHLALLITDCLLSLHKFQACIPTT